MATKKKWIPQPGEMASYQSGSGRRGALNVRVVAEASGGYMVVETVRIDGSPARISVKTTSLSLPQPSLF